MYMESSTVYLKIKDIYVDILDVETRFNISKNELDRP